MEPTRKSVLFVDEGTRAEKYRQTQRRNAEFYVTKLQPAMEVEVVPSVDAAREILRTRPIDVVIFRTRGLEGAARRIKDEHPEIRVIVLSALPRDVVADTIIWISKLDIADPAAFARAVVGA